MDDILSHALEDYEAEFGENFDPSWNPTSEQDLVAKLEASKVNFSTWRSKHEKVWKTLAAIATPVIELGRIASSATENACPPTSAALGGLVAIIKACESVTEAYDFLEQMLTKLQDVLSRWKIDLKHDLDDQMKQQMRQIMVVLLAIIARSQKLIKHSRARRYFVSLAFGKDQKTADLVKQLEELLRSEDRTRLAVSLDKIASLWEKAVHTEDSRVLERLNSPAVEINNKTFAERKEERLKNTGGWFKEEPLCQYWLQHKLPLMMLLGSQGTGKTFLVTALVEDLQKKMGQPDSDQELTSVAYFFIKPGDNLTTLLKSLAYQLQQANPEYKSHVIDIYDRQELYTAKEIWSTLFLEYWNPNATRGARLTLVIDGLDQLVDEEIELFAQDMVKTVTQSSDYSIQVAISGRLKLWADFDFIGRERFIMVDLHKNKADIAEYIDQELAKVRVLKKVDAKERLKFQQMVLKCCDGNFEWARLLLAKCKNQEKKRILKILEDPPKSLDDMIESCFQQVLRDEDIDPGMLQVMLTWLTYAKRPLSFGELYHKVCLANDDEYALMWFNIIAKLSSIFRWKSPRLHQWRGQEVGDDEIEILENSDKGWSKDVSTTRIMFGNSRMRDYLIQQSHSKSLADSYKDRYPPAKNKAECEIVKLCLKTIKDSGLHDESRRFLLRYPARYLTRHLSDIDLASTDEDDKVIIAEGLICMFRNSEVVRAFRLDIRSDESLQAFWQSWIETHQYVEIIQSWLKWAHNADLSCDTDTKTWLSLASASIKELFKPWAETIRQDWLTRHYPPVKFKELDEIDGTFDLALSFLPAFDHMDEQGNVPERFRTFASLNTHSLSAEEIVSMADKSQLPQKSDYLLAIAIAQFESRRSNVAVTYAKRAFDVDNTSWYAAYYLSLINIQLFDFDSSLHWLGVAKNLNPTEAAQLSCISAVYFMQNNRLSEALEASKEALAVKTPEYYVQILYIRCLDLKGDHDVLLQFFKSLAEKQKQHEKDGSLSELALILLSPEIDPTWIWGSIGSTYRSCESSADRSYMIDAIEQATSLLVRNRGEASQIRYFRNLARFYCSHMIDGLEIGIDMLESNANKLSERQPGMEERDRLEHYVSLIGACVFWRWQQAQRYRRSSHPELPKVVNALCRLHGIAKTIDTSKLTPGLAWDITRTILYYGLWMRMHEPESETDWRLIFKKPVLEHLAMLDDSDPGNDFLGVSQLGCILAMAGDLDNFQSLWSVLLLRSRNTAAATAKARKKIASQSPSLTTNPTTAVEAEVSRSLDKMSLGSRSSLSTITSGGGMGTAEKDKEDTDRTLTLNLDRDDRFVCDGCIRLAFDVDEMFSCVICFNRFCSTCLPTTPEHKYVGRVCGNHHEFVRLWPVSEEAVHRVAVERKGEIRLKQDWVQRLRAQWQAVE